MLEARDNFGSALGTCLRTAGPFALCLAISLSSAPAAATNEALEAAREAAAAKDYEVALRWAVKALRETSDAEIEVKIFALMATVYSRTGRAEEATDMYFEILVRQPDFDLPDDAPAEQRATLAAARAAIPPPAGSQPDEPEPASEEQPAPAPSLFAEAQVAYEELDYEKVMPLLRRALKLGSRPELEAQIYALMATLNMNQGRRSQAKKNFMRVLERDPDFELPTRSSPKLLAVLEAAQKELSRGLRAAALATLAPSTATCPQPTGATSAQSELVVGECVGCGAIYNRWWFWTIIGVAVAGGAVGATFAVTQTDTLPPHNYGPIELQ